LEKDYLEDFPKSIRETIDLAKSYYTDKEKLSPYIDGIPDIVRNKIIQIKTNIMNMFQFTNFKLFRRYLIWLLKDKKETITKDILCEYEGDIRIPKNN